MAVCWGHLLLFLLSSCEVIGCYVTQCSSVPVGLWVCRHRHAAAVFLHITIWMTKAAVEHWSLLMWRTLIWWDTQHATHTYSMLSSWTTYHCPNCVLICLLLAPRVTLVCVSFTSSRCPAVVNTGASTSVSIQPRRKVVLAHWVICV